MKKILLASSSPYRQNQLKSLGVKFTPIAPEIDESSLREKYRHLSPSQLAAMLAEEKVRTVKAKFPNSIVIGGDQIAELEGEILTKPMCRKGALYQLNRLKGRTHRLYSSVAVYSPKTGEIKSEVEIATLTMRELNRKEIERYLELDQPFDCVGCYKIESYGILLFSKIETGDFTGITGLPLLKLTDILQKLEVPIFKIFGNQIGL